MCSSCDSGNEVWFITEDVSIIDQTKGGVGTPLFGLARYASFFEQGIPVFKVNMSLKQSIQFHDLESSAGCLFGPEAFSFKMKRV